MNGSGTESVSEHIRTLVSYKPTKCVRRSRDAPLSTESRARLSAQRPEPYRDEFRSLNRFLGPVRGTHYPTYSDALLDWYRAKNVKSVRFMFTWEAVQPALGGSVPVTTGGYADYWAQSHRRHKSPADPKHLRHPRSLAIRSLHEATCTSRTHGAPFTSADFADFWGRFSAAINASTGSDQRVAFDLINEPHTQAEAGGAGVGITLPDWFTCAQAAINAIRAAGGASTFPSLEWASLRPVLSPPTVARQLGRP